jgi:hypothetical protein
MIEDPSRPLLVIDGDSFAHRAYHGLPKSIRRHGKHFTSDARAGGSSSIPRRAEKHSLRVFTRNKRINGAVRNVCVGQGHYQASVRNDSLAERVEFELSGDFVNRGVARIILVRFHIRTHGVTSHL